MKCSSLSSLITLETSTLGQRPHLPPVVYILLPPDTSSLARPSCRLPLLSFLRFSFLPKLTLPFSSSYPTSSPSFFSSQCSICFGEINQPPASLFPFPVTSDVDPLNNLVESGNSQEFSRIRILELPPANCREERHRNRSR